MKKIEMRRERVIKKEKEMEEREMDREKKREKERKREKKREKDRKREKKREIDVQGQLSSICIQFAKKTKYIGRKARNFKKWPALRIYNRPPSL